MATTALHADLNVLVVGLGASTPSLSCTACLSAASQPCRVAACAAAHGRYAINPGYPLLCGGNSRFASLAHNETTTLYFYGDSTVRNVFCALCVAMAPQHGLGPMWTGDLFSEVTRCAGAIGRAPVRAFYWSRLGSFAPLRLPEDRVPLTPTVAFLGLGLWLTWPTPFLSTREWAGYDTWSAVAE